MVQEYMPGCHQILVGLAAGMMEPSKHGMEADTPAPLRAAQCELEEECHLTGGTWIPLSRSSNSGDGAAVTAAPASTSMDKYTATRVTPFLVLDAHHTNTPRPLDEEEDIEIIRGVTIPEILNLIATGKMTITAGWGCLLAIEKLRELGEYP
jgi:hypothetical protein